MRRTTARGMALAGIVLASTLAPVAGAGAHAFLDHAVPLVGSTVRGSPGEVRVWFTEALEPAFSSLRVVDQNGAQVDRQRHIAFRTKPIGDPGRVAGNAAAPMQHDNRREMLDAVARTAEEPGETPIGPREIADEGCRASFGDIGKLDQRAGLRGAGAEPRRERDPERQ